MENMAEFRCGMRELAKRLIVRKNFKDPLPLEEMLLLEKDLKQKVNGLNREENISKL